MHTKHHTQKRQQIDDAAPIGYYIEAQRMKAYSEIEKTRRATGALSNALRARCSLLLISYFSHTQELPLSELPRNIEYRNIARDTHGT